MPPFKVVYKLDPLSPLDLVPRAVDEKRSVDCGGKQKTGGNSETP